MSPLVKSDEGGARIEHARGEVILRDRAHHVVIAAGISIRRARGGTPAASAAAVEGASHSCGRGRGGAGLARHRAHGSCAGPSRVTSSVPT